MPHRTCPTAIDYEDHAAAFFADTATEHCGLPVQVKRFQDIDWQGGARRHLGLRESAACSAGGRHPLVNRGTGYVVQALEAALWAFHSSDNFRDGALRAVNLGEDADTTGAIYGQLAGAYYGMEAIPATWRARLSRLDEIRQLADGLLELAGRGATP